MHISNRRRSKQRGFTLIELIVAISISAILAVYAQSQLAKQAEEVLAQGSATYMLTVANAAQQNTLLNFNNYANSLPVTGLANALQPTMAELVALGRLSSAFPTVANSLPTRQSLQITIQPANCPGANCVLQVLACTTTPVTLGGADVRFDLASTMVSAQGGAGGQSLFGQGNVIRGPVLNVPNPMGNVEGIVCSSSSVDTALFQRFVTIADSRDPNLQGNLTVAGTTTLNGPTAVNNSMTVSGTATAAKLAVGTCAQIDGTTGRAGFGCQNGSSLPAGYTGGVRSVDVVANANLLTSDNPSSFTGNNTNYVLATANNGSGQAELRTSGRSVADRVVPSGLYSDGTACADNGAIAQRTGATGLVVCQGGAWRILSVGASSGDACAPEGATATGPGGLGLLCLNGQYRGMDTLMRSGTPGADCTVAGVGASGFDTTNNNETLICRVNPDSSNGVFPARWMRLRDITSNLSFVRSLEVTEGSVVPKPTCTPAPLMTSLQVLQLIPKSFSSTDGGLAFYADSAAQWTVHMRNGAGNLLAGNPIAVAQVFCYYP